jgi:uncharacterized delta-60 repeat protein
MLFSTWSPATHLQVNAGFEDFTVVRYAADGALDATFSGDGIFTTSVGAAEDAGKSLAIQRDGNIIVAGYSNSGSNYDFAVVRLTANGALDPAFGTNGIVVTPIGSTHDLGLAVAIKSDGKIYVTGCSETGGPDNDFAVVRLTASGALDEDFGTGGKVTTPIGTGHDLGHAVALQEDGKIVVAGSTDNAGNTDFAVVRYWPGIIW